MCYPCYQLWLKKNPSPTKLTTIGKTCTKCKQDKPLSEYNKTQRNKSGLEAHCRDCSVAHQTRWRKDNPDKGKEYNDRWRDRHPDYEQKELYRSAEYKRATYLSVGWDHFLKKTYKLSAEGFRTKLAAQGGGCAICGRRDSGEAGRQMHVDHCHKSGVIRGILCAPCNKGIGMLADSPDRLMSAATYLLQFVDVLREAQASD
jgi:nitrate/TMAO reductase-like tetraheme cytochrome c subunit